MNADPNIAGLNKAELLKALYDNARCVGLGVLQAGHEMTLDEARALVAAGTNRFDYVHGKPLKVSLHGDTLERADLYDRDQGDGKAARIVAELRARGEHA